MRAKPLIIAAIVFFTALSETGWAIRNRVGSSRIPPSSVRGGLIRSPNPIDTSGNLPITGNVRSGRYFRGVVPYRATTSFGASLGSSSLDSFLRDSAGSEDFGTFSGRYRPYWPSGTVTTTRPGRPGVFRPPTTRIGGRAADGFAVPPLLGREVLSRRGIPDSNIRLRPMSMSPREMERVISDEISTYQRERKLVDEQYQARMKQFRQDLKRVSDKAAELKQSLMGKDDSLQLSTKSEPSPDLTGLAPRFVTEGPEEQPSEDKQFDVYEQMKQQIDNLRKSLEQLPIVEQIEEGGDGEEEPVQESSQAERLSEITLSVARAKRILGEYKTFATFSKDKFNHYIRAGEEYLKRGKYYRAADAYTLASIYKPGDPLSFAGKSHALFSAGEYMSSALFLSRALKIFPEYARFEIDLVSIVGSRDKLESRIADVESWLQRSDATELRFLLGYIYCQMGRLERAKEAIDAAYEKMPESIAVSAVKKAIDERIQKP